LGFGEGVLVRSRDMDDKLFIGTRVQKNHPRVCRQGGEERKGGAFARANQDKKGVFG